MSEENREVSKKEKLYTALTVAEIVVGIVGIALFVVLCRTEEDFHRYIVALLLAIIMIVNGTYGLFKKPNNKKKDDNTRHWQGPGTPGNLIHGWWETWLAFLCKIKQIHVTQEYLL